MRTLLFSVLFILGVSICPAAIASTNVSGHITEDTTWDLAGSPYILVGNVTVNSAVTLTISSGVEVQGSSRTLDVYGHLVASGVDFVTSYITIYARSGSDVDLTDCSFTHGSTTSSVYYYGGTTGTMSNCDGQFDLCVYDSGITVKWCDLGQVYVNSCSPSIFGNNFFGSAHLYVTGDPTSIVTAENNWWGSTDPAVIETKITHHADDPARPWVDYEPWLAYVPSSVEPVSFYLHSAYASEENNFGQNGTVYGFDTTVGQALTENLGQYLSVTDCDGSTHDIDVDTGLTQWDIGDRSLQKQVASLDVPVLDDPANQPRGWTPLFLGRPELTGEPIARKRETETVVRGRFKATENMSNIELRLVTNASINSYTISKFVMNGLDAKDTFQRVKDLIWNPNAKVALARAAAHFAAIATVELLLHPVSEYAGLVEAEFAVGDWSQSDTVASTNGFTQNWRFWTRSDCGSCQFVSPMMNVTAGQIIEWEATFRTTVAANGYARVDARLKDYRVEVLRDRYNVVETISSDAGPLGGSDGMGMAMAQMEAGDVGSAEAEAHDIFNNQFFENDVNDDLTFGDVNLVTNLGSSEPTDGSKFLLIEESNDVSGFVTKVVLPAEANTACIDYAAFKTTEANIPEDLILVIAIYDDGNHITVAEIYPHELSYSEMTLPDSNYAYATDWATVCLDISQMNQEVYLTVVYDTNGLSDTGVAVALDNFRSSSIPLAYSDPLANDLTHDSRIDFWDFAVLSGSWQEMGCEWSENCYGKDVNHDGQIGIYDVAVLTDNWLWDANDPNTW